MMNNTFSNPSLMETIDEHILEYMLIKEMIPAANAFLQHHAQMNRCTPREVLDSCNTRLRMRYNLNTIERFLDNERRRFDDVQIIVDRNPNEVSIDLVQALKHVIKVIEQLELDITEIYGSDIGHQALQNLRLAIREIRDNERSFSRPEQTLTSITHILQIAKTKLSEDTPKLLSLQYDQDAKYIPNSFRHLDGQQQQQQQQQQALTGMAIEQQTTRQKRRVDINSSSSDHVRRKSAKTSVRRMGSPKFVPEVSEDNDYMGSSAKRIDLPKSALEESVEFDFMDFNRNDSDSDSEESGSEYECDTRYEPEGRANDGDDHETTIFTTRSQIMRSKRANDKSRRSRQAKRRPRRESSSSDTTTKRSPSPPTSSPITRIPWTDDEREALVAGLEKFGMPHSRETWANFYSRTGGILKSRSESAIRNQVVYLKSRGKIQEK